MGKKIRFSVCVFLLGIQLINTSCQSDGDDDSFVPDNLIIETSALPETINFPDDNLYSDAKFDLGQALFWDPILSGSKGIACASCHHPDFGYADGRELSSGINGIGLGPNRIDGMIVKRNSPTILNTGFNGIDADGYYNPSVSPMFWDNRAMGHEEQSLIPILTKEEMRGESIVEADIIDTVLQRLASMNAYQSLFINAFGNDTINEDRIAKALATFQRSLTANNSRFDDYMRGNSNALSEEEIEGLNTFIEVGCANCHHGPMLSDFELHTLSVPEHPLVNDEGATGSFDFRTPSLRNLAFTAPYMHNGRFDNLEDVLEFYDDISGGGGDSQNPFVDDNEIDEDARDLQLNGGEIAKIILYFEYFE